MTYIDNVIRLYGDEKDIERVIDKFFSKRSELSQHHIMRSISKGDLFLDFNKVIPIPINKRTEVLSREALGLYQQSVIKSVIHFMYVNGIKNLSPEFYEFLQKLEDDYTLFVNDINDNFVQTSSYPEGIMNMGYKDFFEKYYTPDLNEDESRYEVGFDDEYLIESWGCVGMEQDHYETHPNSFAYSFITDSYTPTNILETIKNYIVEETGLKYALLSMDSEEGYAWIWHNYDGEHELENLSRDEDPDKYVRTIVHKFDEHDDPAEVNCVLGEDGKYRLMNDREMDYYTYFETMDGYEDWDGEEENYS